MKLDTYLLTAEGNIMYADLYQNEMFGLWRTVPTNGIVGKITDFCLNEYSPKTHATIFTNLFVYFTTNINSTKPRCIRMSLIEAARARFERDLQRRAGSWWPPPSG